MKPYTLIVHGPGGSYYLVPLASGHKGYRLAFDAWGRRLAAYGHVYRTEDEARATACSYAAY